MSDKKVGADNFVAYLKTLGVNGIMVEEKERMMGYESSFEYKGEEFKPPTDKIKRMYDTIISQFRNHQARNPIKLVVSFQVAMEDYNDKQKAKQERESMFGEDTRLQEFLKEEGIEKDRQRAMLRTQILELLEPQGLYGEETKKVIDRSDKYGIAGIGESRTGKGIQVSTGVGVHKNVGEASHTAKLTDNQAKEIRRIYWAGKVDKTKKISQTQLARDYGLSPQAISGLINRYYYSHIPLVENEPEEFLEKPSGTSRRVLSKAKKEGSQVLLNKEGKLRLTDESILSGRKKLEEK
jgi:hypothetical protein